MDPWGRRRAAGSGRWGVGGRRDSPPRIVGEWAREGSQRRRGAGGTGLCARGPPAVGAAGWKEWAAGVGMVSVLPEPTAVGPGDPNGWRAPVTGQRAD